MISFIIPVYNTEETIGKCIESIMNQDLEIKKEILVIDNDSADRSLEIAQSYPGVKCFRESKRGPAATRNKGLEKAKGDYIAFVDSDVVLPKNWLSKAMEKLENNTSLAAVGGPGKSVVKNPLSDALDKLLFGKDEGVEEVLVDSLAAMDALYRADAIKDMRFDESLIAGEDPEFNFRLRKRGYNLLYSSDLFVYHHHPLSLRGLLKKWYNYGRYYTLPYKIHPEFKNKGYYVRTLFMPFFIGLIFLSLFNPIFVALAFIQLLLLFLSYAYIGLKVKGGFLFPFVHTLKQFAQMLGILASMIRR
jgi:glycosyltransferase involved in cell wall biosynthesis